MSNRNDIGEVGHLSFMALVGLGLGNPVMPTYPAEVFIASQAQPQHYGYGEPG